VGDAVPASVNNSDEVTGGAYFLGNFHAFLWSVQDPTLHDLGTLFNSSESEGLAINDSSQIAGWSLANQGPIPFLWTADSGMTQTASTLLSAFAINGQNTIAGESTGAQAAIWTLDGGVQELGVLPGTAQSYGWAINNHGVVVGNSFPANKRPGFVFLWSPTQGMLNLNSLCKNKQPNWFSAGINDAGQIAINRINGDSLILTPIMKVTAASSLNPSHHGQLVTVTATVTSIAGPPPDGELVTFADSSAVLGMEPLVNGQATFALTGLSVGTHLIQATYPGDTNYASSAAKALKQVVKP